MQITRAPRRHLECSELIDCTASCPVCGSHEPRQPVCRVHRSPDVDMLRCPNCRACSASHMPRPELLESFYARYYDHFDREVTFSDAARFARHVVDGLPRDAFEGSMRILDYGGGDGSLSREVAGRLLALGRTTSVEVVVVDFVLREPAVAAGMTIRYQSPTQPLGQRYDLVLASAILEHVPEAHLLLESLYEAIARGGYFYARTPYAIPLTRLFPRLDLTYPAHVHDMGSPFWDRLAETFGWSVRVVASRPSLVAGRLSEDPLRTLAAWVLKLPAHLESVVSPISRRKRLWHLVGGWEVLLQRT